MRVLHVAAYYAPAWDFGGPAVSISGLCTALRRAGVDAQVFTTTAASLRKDFPATDGWAAQDGVPVRRFARTAPKRFFASRTLAAALRADGAGYGLWHVHGVWNATASLAMREARRLGVPVVLSPRGMLERSALRKSRVRKQLTWHLRERKRLSSARLLHATSPDEQRTIARVLPGVPSVVIPNGVDVEALQADPGHFRTRYDLEPDDALVVFLGRQHRIKRLDLLARAFAIVRAQHPKARLVLAGPPEESPNPATAAALSAVASQTIATGAVDATTRAALLADAAVLVSCSDSESFGMSVAEALAAGVPVVATRTTPWAALEEQRCGAWVPQQVEPIAAAIAHLLDDPARRRAMGTRGRRWVQSTFSWDAVAQRMTAAYKGTP